MLLSCKSKSSVKDLKNPVAILEAKLKKNSSNNSQRWTRTTQPPQLRRAPASSDARSARQKTRKHGFRREKTVQTWRLWRRAAWRSTEEDFEAKRTLKLESAARTLKNHACRCMGRLKARRRQRSGGESEGSSWSRWRYWRWSWLMPAWNWSDASKDEATRNWKRSPWRFGGALTAWSSKQQNGCGFRKSASRENRTQTFGSEDASERDAAAVMLPSEEERHRAAKVTCTLVHQRPRLSVCHCTWKRLGSGARLTRRGFNCRPTPPKRPEACPLSSAIDFKALTHPQEKIPGPETQKPNQKQARRPVLL